MKISNGNKTIEATDKAYRVVYKELGYKPLEEGKTAPEQEETAQETDLNSFTKAELIEELEEEGIEYQTNATKAELIGLFKGD
ncbi:hypothetical protein ACDX78_13480 [Virgibacillus oceani]